MLTLQSRSKQMIWRDCPCTKSICGHSSSMLYVSFKQTVLSQGADPAGPKHVAALEYLHACQETKEGKVRCLQLARPATSITHHLLHRSGAPRRFGHRSSVCFPPSPIQAPSWGLCSTFNVQRTQRPVSRLVGAVEASTRWKHLRAHWTKPWDRGINASRV